MSRANSETSSQSVASVPASVAHTAGPCQHNRADDGCCCICGADLESETVSYLDGEVLSLRGQVDGQREVIAALRAQRDELAAALRKCVDAEDDLKKGIEARREARTVLKTVRS